MFCGATLITQLFLITAAHCVKSGRRVRSDYSVRLGGHSLSDGTTHSVYRTYVHPEYRNMRNDLSLIRLRQKVVFSNNIKPVCLPSPSMASSSFEGKTAMVTGWGTIRSGGTQSKYLKEASVRVVPTKQCDNSYSRYYRRSNIITSNQICANNPGTDTCQGDSGGPIMLLDGSGKWSLIGVTSFGQGCARRQYPGVYTRVGAYLSWIKSVIISA